jgi:hypothetical protein
MKCDFISARGVLLIYFIVGIIIVFGCFQAAVFYFALKRASARRSYTNCVVRLIVWIIVAGLAGAAFAGSLFVRFHRLEADSDGVRLYFAWPKAAINVPKPNFIRASVHRDDKGNGALLIHADSRTVKSVGCGKDVDLERLRDQLNALLGQRPM